MAVTYIPIATQTLSSTASTVTFSSIPQTYTDLVVVVNGTVSTNSWDLYVRFNGDTGSNYSVTRLWGSGSAAGSNRLSNDTLIQSTYYGSLGTEQSNQILNVMNYSNTSTYKTMLVRANRAGQGVDASVGLWRNTAAINSLTLLLFSGGQFAVGSTFSLYGIASASAGTPKATGGNIITTDGSYWYHAFTSSGTFTPTSTLSCDILVAAGGGSGGYSQAGGGGGAGGVLAFASQSVAASTQTVTVGAGGATATTNPANAGSNSQFASLIAIGGGYGGGTNAGGNGGSGGGGYPGTSGGTGTAGQGFAGGSGASFVSPYPSGGGGGAGAVGQAASGSQSGAGGIGTTSVTNWGSLSAALAATGLGVSGYIAGGGGGGGTSFGALDGAGGLGGGGTGGVTAVAGRANTGSGGGGANQVVNGAAGGSGLVIVRYAV